MIVERWTGIEIGAPPARNGGSPGRAANSVEGLLLVGHGSHCVVSASQMHRIGELVAAGLPGVAVEVGFLEMTDPPVPLVLDEMVGRGCRRVAVLPLMLLAAGHTKSDVPAVVIAGRERHPGVDIAFGSALGVAPELLEIGRGNIESTGATGLPLVVIARGTSDPDANAEAAKAGRLLAEWTRSDFVFQGFTGVTWPLTPEALDTVATMGVERLGLFFWFLCNGKLIERARGQIAEFTARTGVEVVDAGYFGPDPQLVPLIGRRYLEAIEGSPTVNCDTCAYRAPFPGHEHKAGQPVGVGHSHLAAEHRHAAHHAHSHDRPHSHDSPS